MGLFNKKQAKAVNFEGALMEQQEKLNQVAISIQEKQQVVRNYTNTKRNLEVELEIIEDDSITKRIAKFNTAIEKLNSEIENLRVEEESINTKIVELQDSTRIERINQAINEDAEGLKLYYFQEKLKELSTQASYIKNVVASPENLKRELGMKDSFFPAGSMHKDAWNKKEAEIKALVDTEFSELEKKIEELKG